MSAADKDAPVVPPKERSPSPDDGLLREEPLELESKPASKGSTEVPTATAPSGPAQTVTAPPPPIVEAEEENPPPKPPRPVSKFEQNVATLAEAFPDTDLAVIKAVLTASGGRVEPAFNALLGMSDPTAAAEFEEAPPPQPPRPRQQPRDFRGSDHYNPAGVYHEQPQPKTSTPASQMEADELYARQLAEHYGSPPSAVRQGRGGVGNYGEPRSRQAHAGASDEDKEHSFFDDELPIIRENIRKGFMDTQKTVNKFLSDIGKKIAGEDEEGHQQQGGGRSGGGAGGPGGPRQQQYPQRYSSRRSGDAYDADPEVLQGDFSHLELRDNTDAPSTNPAPRKTVNFANQSEEDLYRKPTGPSGTGPTATTPSATTGGKWAPLATVDPTPLNNDPFQLVDSDDEHDTIQTTAAKTGPQESGTKNASK
ncbi:ubiquitin-binding protein cue5 [Orbilia ellipsospora]|uniref:Ubiquitin-binding protein cue5 n=1 Tax=Orbilia ellipsospora TaxID=2528407 RepID=A0AAV9X3E5_9PEZI